MIAAAMTGGDIVVENVLTEHQKPLIAKLREAGEQLRRCRQSTCGRWRKA